DSPGMNACIAAVVRLAARNSLRVVGVLDGFGGFVEGRGIDLDEVCVSGAAGRGGTILQTSRNGDLKEKLSPGDPRGMFGRLGIDSLIVMGGGGSMVADAGFPIVGVPCTIDNDVEGTHYTVGFDTACNHAVRAANDILDTAESLPGRVFLIEMLGGDTGHLAVASAFAIGADAVLVPEAKADLAGICGRIKEDMDGGKPYDIIVVAEGVGASQKLVEQVAELTGRRVRPTVLGHAQRGGSPSHWDRTMARRFGEMAALLLLDGESDVMTALVGGSLVDVPLSVAIGAKKALDMDTYNIINRSAK
ncbi:MAG: ATP-dependent 6-phosphofructokinase, partial [Phycisphaerales bacterium]|nr:ATP-dependent 6-phosphofructokinase [Phycisphaerales bacterium]